MTDYILPDPYAGNKRLDDAITAVKNQDAGHTFRALFDREIGYRYCSRAPQKNDYVKVDGGAYRIANVVGTTVTLGKFIKP